MGPPPPPVLAGAGTSAAPRGLLLLLAATTAVALVVAPAWFVFPYVATKVFFLRPLAWAMAAWLAAEVLLGRRPLGRPGPVTWAGLAVLASAALSCALGADPARGVWDTGERMIGLVTMAAAGACYAAALRAGRDAAAWSGLFRAALVVACLVAVGAVVERTGVLGGGRPERAGSTLGSPAFLGAFGLHAAFLGILVLVRGPRRLDRWLGGAAIAAGVLSLALSEARAAAVGLALGGGHLALRAALDGSPRVRRAVLAGGLALVALAVAAFLFHDSAAVQSLPLVRRFAAWSAADSSTSTRFLAWDVALDAARDAPLLGWGPNAFPHAFAAHYRPEFLRWGAGEAHFDDAHSAVFTTLAEQGVLGLAALAALYVAALGALRRARLAGTIPPAVSAAAGAWLLAHAGNLLFSFEDVTSLLCLGLVLAFCEKAGCPTASAVALPPVAERVAPWRRAAAAACVAGALLWTVVADLRPALACARAREAVELVRRDPRAAVARIEDSLSLGSPHAGTEANVFAWTVLQVLPRLLADGRSDEADLLGRGAYDVVGRATKRGPGDVQSLLLRTSLAEATPTLRSDDAVADDLRVDLTSAVTRAPRRQDLRFALAAVEMRRGRFQEAADQVRAVVKDDPSSGWGWARLAVVYQRAGREEEARRIVREARDRGVLFREEDRVLLGPLAE